MHRRRPMRMPGQGPHAGGALVLCGLALACGAAHAQHPWAPVRNVAPQRSANTLREQRPIHCPRSVREPGEGTGSETDALLREFFERHTTMDYEEAAVVARRLLEVSPDRGQAYYNLACVLGRLHRPEEALAALEAAVEHGWRDIVHLSMDPDLAVVRGSERYRRLVAGLGRLLQREQAARSAELAGEVPRILAQYGVPAATMATAGPGGARLASFGPAGPLPEAAVGTVEGEACLRVMAVGALVLHGEPGRPAEAIVHLAGADDGPAPAYRLNVVSRVEAATSEPFLLCCRRHVIEPLGLSASAVSPGPPLTTQPDARSTVADLARLLSAISPTGPKRPRSSAWPWTSASRRPAAIRPYSSCQAPSSPARPTSWSAGSPSPGGSRSWRPPAAAVADEPRGGSRDWPWRAISTSPARFRPAAT
jgi:hypothetical protein